MDRYVVKRKAVKIMYFKICIIILVLLTIVGSYVYWGNREIVKYATVLAQDLVTCSINKQNIGSNYAVFIGEKLQQYLIQSRDILIKGYKINILRGDIKPPFGDGKAQYRIVIKLNNNSHFVTLRVNYDKSLSKFHILGFTRSDN